MPSANPKDYFSAFIAAAETAPVPPSSAPSTDDSPDGGAEKQLLALLARDRNPVSVKAMLGEIRIPPSQVVTALQNLKQAGLVDLRATAEDEMVVLTDLGRRIGGF